MSRFQKYAVELIGTFFLALTVVTALAVPSFEINLALLAGIVLMLFVYTVGPISGANLNPAITISLWSLRRLSTKMAIGYVIVQFIGAVLALLVANLVLPNGRVVLETSATFSTGVAEFLGMVLFAFGVASVAYGQVRSTAMGITVGFSLFAGIALASLLGSHAWLNPAVALTAGSFSLLYLFAPIFGALAGMWLYRIFAFNPNPKQTHIK